MSGNFTNSSTGGLIDRDVQVSTTTIIIACFAIVVGLLLVVLCVFRNNRRFQQLYTKLNQEKAEKRWNAAIHFHGGEAERIVFPLRMDKVRASGGVAIKWEFGPAGNVTITLPLERLEQIEGFTATEDPIVLLATKHPVWIHRPCASVAPHVAGGCGAGLPNPSPKPVENKPPFTPNDPKEWQLLPYDTPNCARREYKLLPPPPQIIPVLPPVAAAPPAPTQQVLPLAPDPSPPPVPQAADAESKRSAAAAVALLLV